VREYQKRSGEVGVRRELGLRNWRNTRRTCRLVFEKLAKYRICCYFWSFLGHYWSFLGVLSLFWAFFGHFEPFQVISSPFHSVFAKPACTPFPVRSWFRVLAIKLPHIALLVNPSYFSLMPSEPGRPGHSVHLLRHILTLREKHFRTSSHFIRRRPLIYSQILVINFSPSRISVARWGKKSKKCDIFKKNKNIGKWSLTTLAMFSDDFRHFSVRKKIKKGSFSWFSTIFIGSPLWISTKISTNFFLA